MRIGFPWSPELVERSLRSCGGTIAATRTALQEGAAVYLAGGTHHARADRGAGCAATRVTGVRMESRSADTAARHRYRCKAFILRLYRTKGGRR